MSTCICITVWHLHRDFYTKLHDINNIDCFGISHLDKSKIPDWISKCIPGDNLFFEKNIGYDWGAYQQFISKGVHKNYDNVCFIHDDVEIIDPRVFEYCANRVQSKNGILVIGNGRNNVKLNWPRTHIHCYTHSNWKPPSWDFTHDTVRGSFFFTSNKLLSQVGSFEIAWDHKKIIGVRAGNWSMLATCGKIQDTFDCNIFEFLSEEYLKSPYLVELERGSLLEYDKPVSTMWRLKNKLLISVCSKLMSKFMNSQSLKSKKRTEKVMHTIFTII